MQIVFTYFSCKPGYHGKKCEYTMNDDEIAAEAKHSILKAIQKTKANVTRLNAKHAGQYCATITTYCVNGDAVVSYEPICQ